MMDNNRQFNLQYFAGTAFGQRPVEDNDAESSNSDITESKPTDAQNRENTDNYMDSNVIYPSLDLTDKNGNPLRDARTVLFKSNVLCTTNKAISNNGLYHHFE